MAAKPKKPAERAKSVKPVTAKKRAGSTTSPRRAKAPATAAEKARKTGEAAAEAAEPPRTAEGAAAPATPRGRRGAALNAARGATAKAAPEAAPARAAIRVRGDEPDAEPDPVATAKLALGPGAEARETPAQVPWSYGLDRVTAAAVDPDRLFVYWEVTDPAIERARAALGKGGPGAWLTLRVYDATGRLFDGTNANSYFDHAIDRAARQWFFEVGKPTSTAFVELGMKSSEGYFATIVRSGRVDFPRREPAYWSDPEWMTVRVGGEVVDLHRSPAAPPRAGGGASEGWGPPSAGAESYWASREPGGVHESVLRQLVEGGWERVEWSQAGGEGWVALEGRVEWESPRVVTSWEAGPFSHPVQIEPPQRELREGRGFAYRVGNVTHVVEGPWRVTIRNLGAHAEREVIGTWEIHRAWSVQGGGSAVRRGAGATGMGASELHWAQGSEERMGGASERWRIGASEVAWQGASERRLMGASEWRYAGASERAYAGASEWRYAGASERQYAGASERRLGGASERALGGASERAAAAGSEARLGASEQRFEGPTAPPLPYPKVDPDDSGREG